MSRSFRASLPWRPALAALIAGLGTGCGGGSSDEAPPETPRIEGVTIVPVTAGPFTERVHAIGTVVPRPGAVALLSAPAATRVTRVSAAVGQRVRKGQVLVVFETAPFQARAQSAETTLQTAERNRERIQRLVDQGILARRELDQAEADLARARAEAVASRREAELATMESPLNGVVTKMSAVLGASVDANQPLVEVADPGALDLQISVSPLEAARIRPGALVRLEPEGGGDEPLGTGRVVDVGAALDSLTRSVPVRARAIRSQRPLRIGENLPVGITVADRAEALLVPEAALVPEGESFKVFVIDARNVAHARPITIGGRDAGMVEVTKGLAAGERIVTHGAFGVEDSATVVPGAASDSGPKAPKP